MNSLLLGLYACVFDTGHCLPGEKQMIYTLWGRKLADKNFFSEGHLVAMRSRGLGAPPRYALSSP